MIARLNEVVKMKQGKVQRCQEDLKLNTIKDENYKKLGYKVEEFLIIIV